MTMDTQSPHCSWIIDAIDGAQEWRWERGRFVEVAVEGRTFSIDRDDLDPLAVKTRADDRECRICQGFLPERFEYCPHCGGKLKAATAKESILWFSPADHGTGLACLDHLIKLEPDYEDVTLPQESDAYAFACAGTPRRLVAIEREQGLT